MSEPAQTGRELDAEVGRAFGFEPRVRWHALSPDGKGSAYGADSEDEVRTWLEDTLRKYPDSWLKDYRVGTWESWPRYSTEISAAMDVARALMTRHRNAFWFYSEHEDKRGFFVRFENFDSPEGGYSAWAATLEHAICVAALKAIEADRATTQREV